MTFYPLERLHRLHDGYFQAFTVNGVDLLLIQRGSKTQIVANRCPHMNSPLTHGTIAKDIIRCPLHGFEYCLDTGLPARAAFQSGGGRLQYYQVVYEGNQVGVCL